MPSHLNYRIESSSHCTTLVCCPVSENFELLARKVLWGENSPSMRLLSFRWNFVLAEIALRLCVTPSTSAISWTGNCISLSTLRERFPQNLCFPSTGLRNPFKGIRIAAKCIYWPLYSTLDLRFLFQNQCSDTMWKFLYSRNPYCSKTEFTSPTLF